MLMQQLQLPRFVSHLCLCAGSCPSAPCCACWFAGMALAGCCCRAQQARVEHVLQPVCHIQHCCWV